MLPARCSRSAWRNRLVIRVHALPLRRLSPLKARYSRITSGFESQKARETKMQAMITRLIFLTGIPTLKIINGVLGNENY
jgi:hypothetical protein